MSKILLVVDEVIRARLEATAAEVGVVCVAETELSGQSPAVFSSDIDAVVIGLELLTLRLVAMCDAHGKPFIVLAPHENAPDSLVRFGITSGLPESSDWNEILRALELEVSSSSENVASESVNDSPLDEPCHEDRRPGSLVAVWGPTGAPGRSVVAINLAAEAALKGARVLLIDADTYGGSIAGYLDLFDEVPGFLAAGRLAYQEQLTPDELHRLSHQVSLGGAQFDVLTGTVSARRWPELSPARIRSAAGEFRARWDFIFVDLGFNLEQDEEIVSDLVGPRRNQASLEFLRIADAVVAVSGSDVVGIARFIRDFDSLRNLTSSQRIYTVANKVRSARTANAGMIKHTLARFAGITDVTTVSLDVPAFEKSVDSAAPLCVAASQSSVRQSLRELAITVMGSFGWVEQTTPMKRTKPPVRLRGVSRERAAG